MAAPRLPCLAQCSVMSYDKVTVDARSGTASTTCEPWCQSPCAKLNGSPYLECGGCSTDDGRHACHRLARDFFGIERRAVKEHDMSLGLSMPLPQPWAANVCDNEDVPEWLATLIRSNLFDYDGPGEPSWRARLRCSKTAAHSSPSSVVRLPSTPPNYDGVAIQVTQRQKDLSAWQLYDEYLSHGLPVVVKGAFRAPADIIAAMRASAAENNAGMLETGKAALCYAGGCQDAAARISAADFGNLLAFQWPLPPAKLTSGAIFAATPGDEYGADNYHVGSQDHEPCPAACQPHRRRYVRIPHGQIDHTCTYVLSLQHEGTKRWTLWSPTAWEVPLPGGGALRPHTRFETTLLPGDLILLPPAWPHRTRVLAGSSTSTSSNLCGPPPYGKLPVGFAARHPAGYDACAVRSPGGWDEVNKAWDAMIRDGQPQAVHQPCPGESQSK